MRRLLRLIAFAAVAALIVDASAAFAAAAPEQQLLARYAPIVALKQQAAPCASRGESYRPVPVGVVSELIRGDIFFWGQLMAGALLGSVPVALVYSFFVEYYVTGLTGSVKG